MTYEVRIHGRGGQGVVTAAELLAAAAFAGGWHAQAFPSFESERTGAPVVAFCRISEQPDQDPGAGDAPGRADHPGSDAAAPGERVRGIASGAIVLLNSARDLADLGITDHLGPMTAMTVPATELGWGSAAADTIKSARLAEQTGLFPVFEAEHGEVTSVTKIRKQVRSRST